jgi:glc operon protein GlcG
MINKLSLDMEDAKLLAQYAQEAARSKGIDVSIVVVDMTTYMQVMYRMDKAPLFSAEGAYDKARSAAEGGHPTTFFEEPLNKGRFSMVTMPHTPVEGGLPIFYEGQCVGGIGIAGAPPHLDAAIGQSAIDTFLKTKAAAS